MVLFRYAGYCPQLKYHLGQTYGQLTAKLLSSPEVSHSQRLVLHTGRFPSTEKDSRPHDEIWRSRHGGRRNLEKMIPGYTGNSFLGLQYLVSSLQNWKHALYLSLVLQGFVPLRQNYFCKTYAETCRDALSEFSQQQEKRLHAASADLSFAVNDMLHPDFKVSCHSQMTSLSQLPCVGSPCLIIHAKYPVSKQVECHMPTK